MQQVSVRGIYADGGMVITLFDAVAAAKDGGAMGGKRILSILSAPFQQESYELVVTPSIGIAMYPEHGSDAQSLLKNADGAMYEAKASGRNQLRVYDSTMNARALKRLSLEMELRRAVENSSLEVYYQPKYRTRDVNMLGGEALLRWFHPERGQIPTGDFIAWPRRRD